MLAVIGYLIIAAWIVQIFSKPALGVFGVFSLAAVWLASNAFGMRTKIPGFRSSNFFAAGSAWLALGFAMLISFGASAPPVPTASTGVGTGPQSTRSPEAVAAADTPAHESPLATPSPSPSPSMAPSPSPKPSPKPSPTQTSTHAPPPAPPPPAAFNYCGAPPNPWHYNFCGGRYIYNPPSSFCSYFKCIPSFWKNIAGYVDECQDGTYSHSGGRPGACSYHGGELRPLWD